jgi:hypothetical protein
MRQDGNGAQKVGRTPTLCNQKSEKHSQSGRAALCGCPSSSSTLLQYELAQASSIQVTWVLATAAEELPDA